MAADLLIGLLRANLAGGGAILLVLLFRTPLQRLFGAQAVYRLWLLPPLIALASLAPFPSVGAWYAAPLVLIPSFSPPSLTTPGPAGSAVIAAVWALGALIQGAVLALRQSRFMAALGELHPAVLGGRQVLRATRANLGPAVVGGAIVVPADFESRFTAEEQEAILAHESTHLARGDLLANALSALAQCLCWFNPLVHLAAVQARIDQELACDAAVIEAQPNLRRSYAEALLKTQFVPHAPPVGCTWPSRAQHPLKERIAMLKLSPPTRLRRTVGAALLAALSLGGGYAAWAAQSAPSRVIEQPDWIQRPTGEDVARVYPPDAAKRLIGGLAVMECGVQASGALSACRIQSQSPEDAGFGAATLQLATLFRMKPADRGGAPTASGAVRIPVLFRMPAAPTAQ